MVNVAAATMVPILLLNHLAGPITAHLAGPITAHLAGPITAHLAGLITAASRGRFGTTNMQPTCDIAKQQRCYTQTCR